MEILAGLITTDVILRERSDRKDLGKISNQPQMDASQDSLSLEGEGQG